MLPTCVTSASKASNRNSVLALDPNRSRRAWIEGPFFQRVAKRRRIDQFKPAARRPDLQELVAPFGDFSRVTVDE
jgi:hypothetical protein